MKSYCSLGSVSQDFSAQLELRRSQLLCWLFRRSVAASFFSSTVLPCGFFLGFLGSRGVFSLLSLNSKLFRYLVAVLFLAIEFIFRVIGFFRLSSRPIELLLAYLLLAYIVYLLVVGSLGFDLGTSESHMGGLEGPCCLADLKNLLSLIAVSSQRLKAAMVRNSCMSSV